MGNIIKTVLGQDAAADAITGQIDQGSLYATGHLSIYDVDSTLITFHQLSIPSFGPALDGTSTANSINDAVSSYDATANYFAFENRDGSAIWNGFCSTITQGGALQLDSLFIPADSTVTIFSAQYIVPQ